jgi:hypothetical protein
LPRPPKRLTAASWWPGQPERSAAAQSGMPNTGSPS